jgi:hypothetical protein
MANVTNLRNGSKGAEVKKLQQALIKAGYDVGKTGADGVLGKNTEAAIRQYQKDNGLAVDGIAGKNTQGMLYGTSGTNTLTKTPDLSSKKVNAGKQGDQLNAAPDLSSKKVKGEKQDEFQLNNQGNDSSPDQPSDGGFYYDPFSYGSYEESDIVSEANALLQQWMSNKPGEYQSQWADELADYLNQIQNRDPFSYNFNADALYHQYKDNYIQQGKMAMMDTMGQAAALTGGYSNSYAQSVGQQAYHQHLNQLNDVIPELHQMAYNRYADEGQQLMNMYNMYLDQENQDYSRYQTELGNWYNNLEYLTNRYETERQLDYNRWQDGRDQAYDEWSRGRDLAYDEYQAELDRAYQQERDAIEDERWQTEFDEDKRRYEQNREDSRSYSYSGSSGGSGNDSTKYKDVDVGSTAYNAIMTEAKRVTSIEDLKGLVNKYIALGYDPAQVNALTESYARALTGGSQPKDTNVGDFFEEHQGDNRNKGRGGGGGGNWRLVATHIDR